MKRELLGAIGVILLVHVASAQEGSAPVAEVAPLVQVLAEESTPGAACLDAYPCCFQPRCNDCRRGTVTLEYLLWWIRTGPVSPLVTAGAVDTGDPASSSGPLTGPGTALLFGGRNLDFDAFSGFRLTWDSWFRGNDDLGLQLGGFRLEQRSVFFGAASDAGGNPIVARPIFDVLNKEESARYVAFPGAFAGAVGVRADSNLWGIESNLMLRGRWDDRVQTKWLLGYRHLDLEESLEMAQATSVLAGGGGSFNNAALNPGDTVLILDRFRGRNEFHGALFGVQSEALFDSWFLGLSFKVSLGCNRQEVHVAGVSARLDTAGALTDVVPGGALALRTNSGTFRDDDFAVIPELGLKAGYRFGDRLHAFLGYDLIYWSDVVRPGAQLNRNINVGHVPTSDVFNKIDNPRQPAPVLRESDFWAQGMTFGLELKY